MSEELFTHRITRDQSEPQQENNKTTKQEKNKKGEMFAAMTHKTTANQAPPRVVRHARSVAHPPWDEQVRLLLRETHMAGPAIHAPAATKWQYAAAGVICLQG